MSRISFRRLTAVTVLALAGAVSAACAGSQQPVSPLAADPVGPPSVSASAPTPQNPTSAPVTATPTGGTRSGDGDSRTCESYAVVHVWAGSTGGDDIPKKLCMKIGGVLEVRNLGPDKVFVTPKAKVTSYYEAGITKCTFTAVGNVLVGIHLEGDERTIEVEIVR